MQRRDRALRHRGAIGVRRCIRYCIHQYTGCNGYCIRDAPIGGCISPGLVQTQIGALRLEGRSAPAVLCVVVFVGVEVVRSGPERGDRGAQQAPEAGDMHATVIARAVWCVKLGRIARRDRLTTEHARISIAPVD